MTIKNPAVPDLSIAISTYNDRISQAISLAVELEPIGSVFIFHQVTEEVEYPPIPDSVRYVRLRSKGVAKSRNAALACVESRYLWFLDDDVTVDVERAKSFALRFLNGPPYPDILTIGILDEMGRPRKNFPTKAVEHNMLSILSVGTIEIIVNREKVKSRSCIFPEDMGAGSKLPVSDEPVFLAQCLKNGLKIEFIPEYFVSHPAESSGGQFTNSLASRSRGVAFRRIYGLMLGGILLTAMFLKNLLKGKFSLRTFLNSYYAAMCGLFKGS